MIMHTYKRTILSALPVALALLVTAGCPSDDTGNDDIGTTDTTDDTTTADTTDTTDTTTTDTTDTTTTDTTDATDTTGTADACETYCNNAMTNCTGDNALYNNIDECMLTCAGMPEGMPTDADSNSAWCRAYHAGDPASMDPGMHCPHASAGGGMVCGSYCEAFCSQVTTNCPGNYPGMDECMATCAAFPADGALNATDGNSVQCRIYHASFPAATDGALHCPHASTSGEGVCGSPCEGYCAQVMANCDLYATETECMDTCASFPQDGAFDAIDGDSVQCRTYHASFPAAADAALHCMHAGPDGGGVCI